MSFLDFLWLFVTETPIALFGLGGIGLGLYCYYTED